MRTSHEFSWLQSLLYRRKLIHCLLLKIKYFTFFKNSKFGSVAKSFGVMNFSHRDSKFSLHYMTFLMVFYKPSISVHNELHRTTLAISFCFMVPSYFPTKQITPRSRVFIENRLGSQLVRMSALYGTYNCITLFTRVCPFSIPWAHKSSPHLPHLISSKSFSILFFSLFLDHPRAVYLEPLMCNQSSPFLF